MVVGSVPEIDVPVSDRYFTDVRLPISVGMVPTRGWAGRSRGVVVMVLHSGTRGWAGRSRGVGVGFLRSGTRGWEKKN